MALSSSLRGYLLFAAIFESVVVLSLIFLPSNMPFNEPVFPDQDSTGPQFRRLFVTYLCLLVASRVVSAFNVDNKAVLLVASLIHWMEALYMLVELFVGNNNTGVIQVPLQLILIFQACFITYGWWMAEDTHSQCRVTVKNQ